MNLEQFEDRKRSHIEHSLDEAHQARGLSGLNRIRLSHLATPDQSWEDVTLQGRVLGHQVPTPFFIAGMTAGHADAPRLNRIFAAVCEKRGWALGVGSQRRDLFATDGVDPWSQLREEFPSLRWYANVGAAQVGSLPLEKLKLLVERMRPTAFAIHLNALQEALQPEGTPDFRGLRTAVARFASQVGVPVIVKETGCGVSGRAAQTISSWGGVSAVDVSGLGGTHWGRIEGARAENLGKHAAVRARAAEVFKDWGIPTVESVLEAGPVLTAARIEIWASGGVRSGLDAVKLIALGANHVGFAQPALKAAQQGESALDEWMSEIEFQAKVALFCTGYQTPEKIRGQETVWKTIET